MTYRDPPKCCPCCGTTEHLEETIYYAPDGGIWQFVGCASRGDGDPMDAIEARDRWNRGPIQIRAEVA